MPEPYTPPWTIRPSVNGDLSDEKLALFIGPRWETYKRKLAVFREDPGFVPTWNWAAALTCPVWFLYRKLFLAFAAFFILPNLAFLGLTGTDLQLTPAAALQPENAWLVYTKAGVFISTVIAAGGTANWLLFRRARAAIRLVSAQKMPAPQAATLLGRVGGVSRTGPWLFVALSLVVILATLRA